MSPDKQLILLLRFYCWIDRWFDVPRRQARIGQNEINAMSEAGKYQRFNRNAGY